MFEAAIFDLDGLLIDSEPLQVQAWNTYLQRFELELDEYELNNLLGKRASDTAEYFYRRYDIPDSPISIYQEQQVIFNSLLEDSLELLPGVTHALTMFKENNVRLALGTTLTIKDTIYDIIERLEIADFFDVIVGADMISGSKPEPVILLACAETLALHPANCLALDSNRLGVEAALNAGMKVICVPGRYTPRWKVGGADLVVPGLDYLNLPAIRALWTDAGDRLPQPQLQAMPSWWRR
jgi:HAD superfamily hydrolase (TIGR01509 family)